MVTTGKHAHDKAIARQQEQRFTQQKRTYREFRASDYQCLQASHFSFDLGRARVKITGARCLSAWRTEAVSKEQSI